MSEPSDSSFQNCLLSDNNLFSEVYFPSNTFTTQEQFQSLFSRIMANHFNPPEKSIKDKDLTIPLRPETIKNSSIPSDIVNCKEEINPDVANFPFINIFGSRSQNKDSNFSFKPEPTKSSSFRLIHDKKQELDFFTDYFRRNMQTNLMEKILQVERLENFLVSQKSSSKSDLKDIKAIDQQIKPHHGEITSFTFNPIKKLKTEEPGGSLTREDLLFLNRSEFDVNIEDEDAEYQDARENERKPDLIQNDSLQYCARSSRSGTLAALQESLENLKRIREQLDKEIVAIQRQIQKQKKPFKIIRTCSDFERSNAGKNPKTPKFDELAITQDSKSIRAETNQKKSELDSFAIKRDPLKFKINQSCLVVISKNLSLFLSKDVAFSQAIEEMCSNYKDGKKITVHELMMYLKEKLNHGNCRNYRELFQAIGNEGLSSEDSDQLSKDEIRKKAAWTTFQIFFDEKGHFERWVNNHYSPGRNMHSKSGSLNQDEKKEIYLSYKGKLRENFLRPDLRFYPQLGKRREKNQQNPAFKKI